MPATQTITAFYSFNPSTTIRSAEVNNNFDFIRGNIYPIDASATAFANNTYDLGSTSASWRNTYTRDLILGASGTISLNTSSITTFSFPTTSGRLAVDSTTVSASVRRSSSSQSVGTAATKVQWNAENWDTHSAFDSSTNYRFTVPTGADGLYQFSGSIAFPATASFTSFTIFLYKNGTTIKTKMGIGSASVYTGSAFIFDDKAVAGDYYEIYITTTGASTLLLSDASINGGSIWDIKRIGPS